MNNNSKQSIQSRRELFVMNQRSNTLAQDLESKRRVDSLRNTLQTQQKVGHHQAKVNEIGTQIQLLSQNAPFNINAAFDSLFQLIGLLQLEETVYIRVETLVATLQALRDNVAAEYEIQKSVQYQLLTYYADQILTFTTRKHLPKFRPEEIMVILTAQVEPRSRDFLIQNARNSDLWTQAVVNQGLQLVDEDLMEIMLRMLDQPHAWKVFLSQKKMPFNQAICQQAWDRKKASEVGSFIIQQVMKGGAYFQAFCQNGIYEAFKIFIAETTSQEFDQQIKIVRVSVILEGLTSLWSEEDIISDTKQIFESRIFEQIAAISIELFDKDALFLVFGFTNIIEYHPGYDLNEITLTSVWYQGLYRILLQQRINDLITQRANEKIENLCKGRLSFAAGQRFKDTIKECQIEAERRIIPQSLVKEQY